MAEMQVRDRDQKIENVSQRPTVTPSVDVYENEKEILLYADLPGVEKDKLGIHVDGETLTLEGRRSEEVNGSLLVNEYRPQDFRRTFNVPPGIDRDKIEAELTAGVLKLHLPKVAALQPRKIEVRTS